MCNIAIYKKRKDNYKKTNIFCWHTEAGATERAKGSEEDIFEHAVAENRCWKAIQLGVT